MPNSQKQIVEISSASILKFIFFVLALVFFYIIRDIIAIIFVSIVIASGVRPAANWFQKYYFPRVLSVITVYIIAFIILGSIFYLVIPPLFFEVSEFLSLGQESLKELPLKILPGIYDKLKTPVSFNGILNELVSSFQKFAPQLTQGFFGTVAGIFGGVISFIIIIVISFYLSVQEGGIEHFLRIITPSKYENYILSLWDRSYKKISKWFRGQLLLGLIVGSLVFIGLAVLGVKYAVSLALIAAIFELIPIFGPILSSIPAIIIAAIQEPWIGITVLILYVIIQQLENHIIYPFVMRKIIGIPSIVVILSLLIGGKLAGFFGILLSVPAAVIVLEIFNDVAEKKKRV